MSRTRWHILRDGDSLTLARTLPARFDVEASARFPHLRADRLARQIRQDLWRELKDLRGFSPVVSVQTDSEGMSVRAGGRVAGGQVPPNAAQTIQSMLTDPGLRARWSRWARLGPGAAQ